MGRRNRITNHVSYRPGTDMEADIPLDLEDGMIIDRHSKYWKKSMKELRNIFSEPGSRTYRH